MFSLVQPLPVVDLMERQVLLGCTTFKCIIYICCRIRAWSEVDESVFIWYSLQEWTLCKLTESQLFLPILSTIDKNLLINRSHILYFMRKVFIWALLNVSVFIKIFSYVALSFSNWELEIQSFYLVWLNADPAFKRWKLILSIVILKNSYRSFLWKFIKYSVFSFKSSSQEKYPLLSMASCCRVCYMAIQCLILMN